ncbi:MAG: T9SS type B sorting domain-containing protein, partial [Chitinophagaceae bacterium]
VKRIGAGGNAYSIGRGITTDPSNNIYVIGYYDISCDLDPGANEFNVTSLAGSEDVFLVKLDNDGNFIWGKTMGGNLDDRGEAVKTDIAGNVYTTGNFSAAADFDPGTATYNLTSGSKNDIFISKLDPSGNFAWAKQFRGSTGTNAGLSLATDLSLNVYTTGTFVHTVDFDPSTTDYILSASAIPSAFIHKMGYCRNSSTNMITTTSCGPYTLNNQVYNTSGTYIQTLQNAAGCDSIISLRLTVNGSITTTAVTSCEPYTWEGQTFTTSGHHSITFPLASGCDSVLNLDLMIASPPADFLKPLDSICQNENLRIEPLHIYSTYEWSTGSDQPTITVTTPGIYDLSVKDVNGCTGNSSITILPRSCYPDIIFPTAFTPNGDQLNDIFKTIINKQVISYRLEVFNRNGQLVFRSTDPEKGWNGTINGTPASTAVFVWQCMYQLPGQEKKFQKGTVALIR